jgi:miniconductance mechanosensitive channel
MSDPRQFLIDWLQSLNLPEGVAYIVAQLILAAVILLLVPLTNWIARRILIHGLREFIRRSRTQWDDILLEKRFFHRLAHLAPALVIYLSAPLFPELQATVADLAIALMGLAGLLVIGALLDSFVSIYRTFEVSKARPIKGYIQAIKVFVYVMGGIAILATAIGESPWKLLGGIGAVTAIVLLVFKDSILGLVASIQISANDMLRVGDWIEMKRYGADGDVIDVTIQCVKVRNWDKTITTIPTYALVSDAFRNWRGMQESGGRRIKRALHIDMNSIRFCTPEMLERFRNMRVLKDYIDRKLQEVERYNREIGMSPDVPAGTNGRWLTNIGTFRAYVREYLKRHPRVHSDMTLLVRHLSPTENGLPIEIYVFSNDIRWAEYESIQADIFDHILAVVPEFGLRVFQRPSGLDLKAGLTKGVAVS